jgi:hypothetical protein
MDPEILALVRAAHREYERNIAARCPCLAAAGEFASAAQCVKDLGRGVGWVDCVGSVVDASNRASVRAYLTCFAEGVRITNTCLESASCDDDEVVACDALRTNCPPPEATLLTQLAPRCSDTIGFR